MQIYDYTTRGGKNVILSYIEQLPANLKVVAYQIRHDISKDGFDALKAYNTRQIQGKLWEIKFSNQRIMYVMPDRDSILFLHICKKEKRKAGKMDLMIAMRRALELGYTL